MTITEFLLARIAEDEAVAQLRQERIERYPTTPSAMSATYGWTHFVKDPFGPARVLAECEATRRIMDIHRPHDHHGEHGDAAFCDECQWDHGDDSPRIDNQPVENFGQNPCRTLVALALPYADHPDYDEAWRA